MLLVVVEVAAAGFAVAGAGAVAVGALAACAAAVADGFVHGVYCSTPRYLLSTCVEAWLVGWLVGWLVITARLGVCLSAFLVGFVWWCAHCFVGVGCVPRTLGERVGRVWGVGWWRAGWSLCGECRRERGCYFALSGGLGIWRLWPSWRSCSASSAVTTRPQMGGHCRAYFPPAHTARSWAASWGADTGCVRCWLSGLV